MRYFFKNNFTSLEVEVLFNYNAYGRKKQSDSALFQKKVHANEIQLKLHSFHRKVCADEVQLELFKNIGVYEESNNKGTEFCFLCRENTTASLMNRVTEVIVKYVE